MAALTVLILVLVILKILEMMMAVFIYFDTKRDLDKLNSDKD